MKENRLRIKQQNGKLKITPSDNPFIKVLKRMKVEGLEYNEGNIEEKDKTQSQFILYCLTKLEDNNKRKEVLDFYLDFWKNLFNHIPTLNEIKEESIIEYEENIDSFDIEVNNMFGIEDNWMNHSYFLLKPYTFNFLHINIQKIRDRIDNIMKQQYGLNKENYTLNLRTYIDEPSNIIEKIVFHNLNQMEKNDKTLNIIWNEEALIELCQKLKDGDEFYIKTKDTNQLISFKDVYKKEFQHNKFETLKKISESYMTRYGYKSKDRINSSNEYQNTIFIDLDNDRFLYPCTFYISFDIYRDKEHKPLHQCANNRVEDSTGKLYLSDHIAGKLQFDCLIPFNMEGSGWLVCDFYKRNNKKII